jgi:hypothetical protein
MMGGRKRRDSLSVRIIIMGAPGRATPSTCAGFIRISTLARWAGNELQEIDKPELEDALRNF